MELRGRGAESPVLGVVLLPALDLRIMARGPCVLDAIMDVDVGVDALANVMRQGLINLLVDITVVASAAWWARELPSWSRCPS